MHALRPVQYACSHAGGVTSIYLTNPGAPIRFSTEPSRFRESADVMAFIVSGGVTNVPKPLGSRVQSPEPTVAVLNDGR